MHSLVDIVLMPRLEYSVKCFFYEWVDVSKTGYCFMRCNSVTFIPFHSVKTYYEKIEQLAILLKLI